MTLDRFTPRLFLAIAAVSLLCGVAPVVYMLWAGYQMSPQGHVAIFLGSSFTAALSLLLSASMHISQAREEREQRRQGRSASTPPAA